MRKDTSRLVHLTQALTFRVENIIFGGSFAGCWRNHLPVHRLIYIFKEGSLPSTISDDRDVFAMKPGHWLFIPAGHRVEHNQHEGLELISIHFTLLYYSNPGIIPLEGKMSMGNLPEKEKEFLLLMQKNAGVTEGIHLQKLLYEFLLPILEKEKKNLDQYLQSLQTFQTLLDLFQKEPCRSFSIDDMAKVMKMGRETFVKKFKACIKIPPKKFFNRSRAAAAANKLKTSTAAIREIAEEFGFSNEFYFSRFIREHLGMSPHKYRNSKNLP